MKNRHKIVKALSEKSWLSECKHLLFDYDLLKNILNMWLPDKTSELIFDTDGVKRVTKGGHLKQFFRKTF